MSYYKQPILLMFLGVPGSGKTYFAKAIADKLNAVRINGDSMRLAMFGSRENIEALYRSRDRKILNSYVFNGLDYVAEQLLLRGHDVVYDAHHNTRKDRAALEELAARHEALPVVVRIETPYEVALERGQVRDDTVDQRRLTADKMREVMARHKAMTDEPTEDEFVITIDGQAPFNEQFAAFEAQLGAVHAV